MTFSRYEAKTYAKKFVNQFDHLIEQANLVGSWVRDPKKHKYVSDIDLVCISKKKIYHGPPLDIWFCEKDEWEAALLYLSIGQLNIKLAARAKWQGYKLNYRGLFKRDRLETVVSKDPQEICKIIEMEMPVFAQKTIYEDYGRLK